MKHLVFISILLISITVMIYLIKRNKKETFSETPSCNKGKQLLQNLENLVESYCWVSQGLTSRRSTPLNLLSDPVNEGLNFNTNNSLGFDWTKI